MAKKFDIHEWQAKQKLNQYLAEQEDFTPDLEDDELKRGAIQQMMSKEKESSWKPSNFKIKSNIEKTWESYEIMTDDLIEFIQMQYDENGSDIIEDWNGLIRKIQEKLKSLGGDEDELNEVDIKRVIDQSMSNDDIGKLQDVVQGNDLGKVLNTLAVIVDQDGSQPELAAQKIADLVPDIIDADAAIQKYHYGNDDEEEYSALEKAWDNLDIDEMKNILDSMSVNPQEAENKDFDQLKSENGQDFEEAIASYVGLGETNMTGTGATFKTGVGMGHFGKKKLKK